MKLLTVSLIGIYLVKAAFCAHLGDEPAQPQHPPANPSNASPQEKSGGSFLRLNKSFCNEPNHIEYRNISEIPENRISQPLSCQPAGQFGPCATMAARNLLEMHQNGNQDSATSVLLSTAGLMGLAAHENLPLSDGQDSIRILQKVRLSDYKVYLDDLDPRSGHRDYERLVKGDLLFANQTLAEHKFPDFEQWVNQYGSPDLKHFLSSAKNQDWYHNYLKQCSEDEPACLFRALFPPGVRKQIRLQPFNLYVFSQSDLNQRLGNEEWGSKRWEEITNEAVEKRLSKGIPLGYANANHVVSLIGSRKACCIAPLESTLGKDSSKSDKCETEIKVLDSLETDQLHNNWFLPKSVFESFNELFYLIPCRRPENPTASKELEACLPDVQAELSLKYTIVSGDVRRIKEIASLRKWDPNSRVDDQRPLELAIGSGEVEMFSTLVGLGAKLKEKDWSTFNEAAHDRNGMGIMKRMVDQSLVDLKKEGPAAWEAAVGGITGRYNNLPNLRFLLAHNATRPKGSGILRQALRISGVDAPVVKFLLKMGLDPNETDNGEYQDKKTALHYGVEMSCFTKKTDIVEALCESKADPKIKNSKGKTPLDLAREGQFPALVELLEKRCHTLSDLGQSL
jgi:hypothetical protein